MTGRATDAIARRGVGWLVVAALAGCGASPAPSGRAGPSGDPTPQPNRPPAWSSSFESEPWFTEWDGHDPTYRQPQFWPQADPIRPVARIAGGTEPFAGRRAMRFAVGRADRSRGRIHAKLFKTWPIRGATLRGDVSGVYRCQVLWPAGRAVEGNLGTGLLGWKEIARHRRVQDPTWMALVRSRAFAETERHRWVGERPARTSDPTVYVDHWRSRPGTRTRRLMAVPVGRWFEVRAEVREGRRIDWFIDGRYLATSDDAVYPVGPRYGKAADDEWVLEIGNYGDATGSTFVDSCSFARS